MTGLQLPQKSLSLSQSQIKVPKACFALQNYM